MVNVELKGLFVEQEKKEILAYIKGSRGRRWYSMVALRLLDLDSNAFLSEWFYLVVCSPEYKKHPLKPLPDFDDKYVIMQNVLDMQAIEEIALSRLSKVHAKNWPDFYSQMEQYFLHED